MSMDNYGKTGYGFRCMENDYEKVMAFIEKHLCAHDKEFFKDCETLDEIEDVCGECEDFADGYSDASGILAYVIQSEVHSNIAYCHDDYNYACILMLPSMPWDMQYVKPITKEEFEEKADALALEFFGKPVKFDWKTTEEWG